MFPFFGSQGLVKVSLSIMGSIFTLVLIEIINLVSHLELMCFLLKQKPRLPRGIDVPKDSIASSRPPDSASHRFSRARFAG